MLDAVDNAELIARAQKFLNHRKLPGGDAGDVAAALISAEGNLYFGVCIDVSSGIGFCAEHSAIAAMITAGETQISKIVAVWQDKVLPPCGRCRELINQIDENNLSSTKVVMSIEHAVPLSKLLPHPFQEVWE